MVDKIIFGLNVVIPASKIIKTNKLNIIIPANVSFLFGLKMDISINNCPISGNKISGCVNEFSLSPIEKTEYSI